MGYTEGQVIFRLSKGVAINISSLPSIAIVGAGIAGVICARVLQMHGIVVSVFEAEPAPNARPQGGALDIHGDSGQPALKMAGLFERFEELSHQDASATKMFDAESGEILYGGVVGGDGWNPEIDRGDLRDMLCDSLLPGTITWDAKVSRVRRVAGQSVIEFNDGQRQSFDLVIGADGTWSKVRQAIVKRKPKYSGVFLVESRIEDWAQTHPASHALIAPGSVFAVGRESLMMVHSGHDAWVSAGFYVPEAWQKTIDWTDTAQAKAAVLARLATWDPALSDLIRHATLPLTPRPMYVLPVNMRWRGTPGLTLIGDAAHVMPIFAGRGANLALLDGAMLGQAIVDGVDDWQGAVRASELAMFKRTWKPALLSLLALNQYFGPHAAKRVGYTFATAQAGVLARLRRLANLFTSSVYVTGRNVLQRSVPPVQQAYTYAVQPVGKDTKQPADL